MCRNAVFCSLTQSHDGPTMNSESNLHTHTHTHTHTHMDIKTCVQTHMHRDPLFIFLQAAKEKIAPLGDFECSTNENTGKSLGTNNTRRKELSSNEAQNERACPPIDNMSQMEYAA